MTDREIFLSLVIPAYNEEKRLPGTLEKVLDYLARQDYTSEVIVVDDGSEDGTPSVVESFQKSHPNLRLIRNDHRGKGYAVRTGVLAAQGRYIVFSDADLATPIEELPKLLEPLQSGYDVAIGSREGLGARRYGEPWHRHLMGRVFNFLVRLLVVGHYQDTQCGFKGFRREAGHELFRRVRLYGEEAGVIKGGAVTAFDVEVLLLAHKRGYKVKEVPVEWYYGENTKVNPLRDSIRMLKDIFMVRWNEWRGLYDN
ncbi:MAG: glycosyltransferase family 2 protein [Chloroflexi bacterium]|nr:MAG: glycosyltransferase family 2 protein [Chloroflexota bacterium]HDN80281.1 glycosyltransferase family 2 protein [Chloroflexota bacterium]